MTLSRLLCDYQAPDRSLVKLHYIHRRRRRRVDCISQFFNPETPYSSPRCSLSDNSISSSKGSFVVLPAWDFEALRSLPFPFLAARSAFSSASSSASFSSSASIAVLAADGLISLVFVRVRGAVGGGIEGGGGEVYAAAGGGEDKGEEEGIEEGSVAACGAAGGGGAGGGEGEGEGEGVLNPWNTRSS